MKVGYREFTAPMKVIFWVCVGLTLFTIVWSVMFFGDIMGIGFFVGLGFFAAIVPAISMFVTALLLLALAIMKRKMSTRKE